MKYQQCDVCVLLDGDMTLKECSYCSKCKAWICNKDLYNVVRRALAMAKRKAVN